MLLIVAVHITYLISDTAPVHHQILYIFLIDSSILFVFIAGYLFQYLIDEYDYRKYLVKKFRNVILPYLIMSLPAIYIMLTRPEWLGSSWIQTPSFESKPLIVKILLYYATGAHLPQFWFIPMICIFYLVSPVLRYIDDHPRWYYAIPFLIAISFMVDRPEFNNNSLQSFVFFLPIYLLGMHSSHYHYEYLKLLQKYWVVILLAVLIFTGFSFINHQISLFQKISLTFLVLIILWKVSWKGLDRVLGLVAKYSFGIFFIHKYVIVLVTFLYIKLSVDELLNSGIVGWTITFVLITSISILLLMPVKYVLKNNSRMVIGS